MSPLSKDLWIARWSGIALVAGSLMIAFAVTPWLLSIGMFACPVWPAPRADTVDSAGRLLPGLRLLGRRPQSAQRLRRSPPPGHSQFAACAASVRRAHDRQSRLLRGTASGHRFGRRVDRTAFCPSRGLRRPSHHLRLRLSTSPGRDLRWHIPSSTCRGGPKRVPLGMPLRQQGRLRAVLSSCSA